MDEASALARHPELAQLWTLHYAGRMGLRVLETAHPFPEAAVEPAVARAKAAVGELLSALEQYRAVVESAPRRPVITIAEPWSASQADAMAGLLHRVADAVARAHERRR